MANTQRTILCALSLLAGCATSPAQYTPDRTGAPIGPHMRSISTIKGLSQKQEFEPWSPNAYYPQVSDERQALVAPATTAHKHIKKSQETTARPGPTAGSTLGAGAWVLFRTYKETFSRLDGNRCGFVPSCSRFGYHAVRRHGLKGWVMTFARLMRNHADLHFYRHHPNGFLRDPIHNYTFFSGALKVDAFHQFKDPAQAWYMHIETMKHITHPK